MAIRKIPLDCIHCKYGGKVPMDDNEYEYTLEEKCGLDPRLDTMLYVRNDDCPLQQKNYPDDGKPDPRDPVPVSERTPELWDSDFEKDEEELAEDEEYCTVIDDD